MSWFRGALRRPPVNVDDGGPQERGDGRAVFDLDAPVLSEPVGPGQANRTDDVSRLERSLGAQGYLDLGRTRRPLGRFDSGLDGAVRRFQADNRLNVDGLANPDGPTLETLATRLAEGKPPDGPKPLAAEARAANARTARAMSRTTDLGSMPTRVADTHLAGGETADADLDDLFGQLRAAAPERADALFHTASDEVARRTGRPLAAARFPTLLADADGGDDETSEQPRPEKPRTPEEEKTRERRCRRLRAELGAAERNLESTLKQARKAWVAYNAALRDAKEKHAIFVEALQRALIAGGAAVVGRGKGLPGAASDAVQADRAWQAFRGAEANARAALESQKIENANVDYMRGVVRGIREELGGIGCD